MKKIYSLLVLSGLVSSLAWSQVIENVPLNDYLCKDKQHIKECPDPLVDRVDVYLRDADMNGWHIDQTFYYTYNDLEDLAEINVFDYNDSIFSQKYLYEYYSNQLLAKRSLQYFVNGKWQDNVLYYYTYNTDNNLWKLTIKELLSTGWSFTQRHIYRYNTDKILTGFLRQRYVSGSWVNYVVHSYTYNDLDLLEGITETRVSDNEIFRQEFYSYDKNTLLTERLVQVKNNDDIWENTLRVEYVYDQSGKLIKRYNQSWINDEWVDDVMRVYHYQYERTPKAEICHKGQTICVSINAVHAHIAHGDYPGKCKVCEKGNASGNLKSASVQTPYDSESNIAVYPNPFIDKVIISLNENHPFSRIEIFEYTGKLVRSIDNPGSGEIVLDMSDLPKGIYLLKATGAELYSTKLILE
jgi:hypothetical protein